MGMILVGIFLSINPSSQPIPIVLKKINYT